MSVAVFIISCPEAFTLLVDQKHLHLLLVGQKHLFIIIINAAYTCNDYCEAVLIQFLRGVWLANSTLYIALLTAH